MIAITDEEIQQFIAANNWATGLGLSDDRKRLFYSSSEANSILLKFPETPLRATYITRVAAMVGIESEDQFYGATLWLKYWDAGSVQLVKTGWKLMEKLRLAYGETRPIPVAPGHSFDAGEFLDLCAFLLPCFVFGWDAYLIPSSNDFFVFISHDDYWAVITKTKEVHTQLMESLSDLKPQGNHPGLCAEFCRP